MNANLVVEIAEGKIKAGVDRETFLQASDQVMIDLQKMEGYLRRELLMGEDGFFVDLVYWDSLDHAQRAMEIFPTLSGANLLGQVMDFSSISMRHLRQVREYDHAAADEKR